MSSATDAVPGRERLVDQAYRQIRDAIVAVRLQPGKRLLLQAVPEIPAWVANRPKQGFLFPFERWLGVEWRDTFAAVERSSPVPLETWYRKWCVFVLQQWLETMGVAR